MMNIYRLKNYLIALILAFCLSGLGSSSLVGQGLELTFGTEKYDAGAKVEKALDGGYIIAGASTPIDSASSDMYLLKLDSAGEEEWSVNFGAAKAEGVNGLIATADGGYFISGYTRSFAGGTGASNALDQWFIKTDALGNLEWENILVVDPEDDFHSEAIEANDGGYIVMGTTSNYNSGWYKAIMYKLNPATGDLMWYKVYEAPETHMLGTDIIALADNSGYAFCGEQDYVAFINITDNAGNVLLNQEYTYPGIQYIRGQQIIQTDDGGFLMGADSYYTGQPGDPQAVLFKVSANGTQEWSNDYGGTGRENIKGVCRSANGNFCFIGHSNSVGNNFYQTWLMEVDVAGNKKWERFYGGIQREFGNDIGLDDDNGFFAVGSTRSYGEGNYDVYFLKTDSLGYVSSNYVAGNIFEDLNLDCEFDAADFPLSKWLIRIAGNTTYELLTDEAGFYQQNIPPGDYLISVHPPNNYWEGNCFDTVAYSFVNPGDHLLLDIPVTERVDCPYLEVDIAPSFIRICSNPKYYVNYCNTGSATAENAFVEVLMDPYIMVDSASIPITDQVGDLYTFELGNVEQSACGEFILYTSVACDTSIIGYTHCVEANIFPDSFCIHPDSLNWNGASISLAGVCQGDSIHFSIENVGTAPTSAPREYIVIEDDVMYLIDDVDLDVGELFEFAVPANGSTYRLEAEQEPGHPGYSMPSLVVQSCGLNSNGTVSQGFVNIFAFNEGDPTTSINCQPNVYPFDPNDKQGFPNGYDTEHFIELGQAIDYLIRFQNTGNAEAYTVSIVDTLSEHIDILSLRPGASSHPYEYEVFPGNVIRFTFKDINLPDSTADFAGSQGFIQFKGQQHANAQLGDVIYNAADIHFDFASPVRTNETWHTIGEDFLEIIVHNEEVFIPNLQVKVQPNPFQEQAMISLEQPGEWESELLLYNVQGQLLRRENFVDNQLSFAREGLGAGIYFYVIQSEGSRVATGRMVIQ